MRSQKGFTLIEMIVVIVLSSIIAVVSMQLLAQGFAAYLSGQNVTSAQNQIWRALERMSRDIRAVSSPASITTATASQFSFTDIANNSISYTLSGSSLMLGSNVLADGISALTFSYYDKNGTTTATLSAIRFISVSLTITQGGTNYTVSTSIYPRAFS